MLATYLGGRVLHGQTPKKPQNKWQSRARQKLFPDVSIQTARQTRERQQLEAVLETHCPFWLVSTGFHFQECNMEPLRANPAQKPDKNKCLNRSRKASGFYSGWVATGHVPKRGEAEGTEEAPH